MTTYSYDGGTKIVRFVASSESLPEERLRDVVKMITDSSLPENVNVLLDMSRVINPPTFAQMQTIAFLIELLLGRFGRRIAVLNSSASYYTYSQMSVLLARTTGCKAFQLEKQAMEWLLEGT